MQKIRAGIIGLGFIGPAHAEAVARLGDAQVVSLCGRDPEKTRKVADRLGIPRVVKDFREMVQDPGVDVVHICTPNHLHFEAARAAIKAGKHVVCEKPLALNLEEGEELARLAKSSGLVCAVHLNCRAYPLVQQARAMVEKGELGEVFAVNGSYQQDWLHRQTDYSWRLLREKSGATRAVADIGTHWFDLVEHVTGLKVQRLCADFATFHKTRKRPLGEVETFAGKLQAHSEMEEFPVDTEDYASALLRFDRGAHGTVTISQVAAGRKNRLYFEIYGSKAALAFDSEQANLLWIGRRDAPNQLLIKDASLMHEAARAFSSYPGGHGEGFADTIKHTLRTVYSAIRDGSREGYPTFEDGLRELRVCDAMARSDSLGAWVDVG